MKEKEFYNKIIIITIIFITVSSYVEKQIEILILYLFAQIYLIWVLLHINNEKNNEN